jgi:hypothetical protein
MRANGQHRPRGVRGALALCTLGWLVAAAPTAPAGGAPSHGLWVWHGSAVLAAPQGAERLRDFCHDQGIGEVYFSAFTHRALADPAAVAALVELLHRAGVRLEALLSSTDADLDGRPRSELLEEVRAVLAFNREHPASRIDGIHLDIEPQQRPENKGAGNLRFLPGLVATYGAVRALADGAGLSVDADIQGKVLKGDADQRRALLGSLPRLTLMLYELGGGAGRGSAGAESTLREASHTFFESAYAGLSPTGLATLAIGLRTQDYGAELPKMLAVLDEANGANPHYGGWARHSYNDVLAER